MLKFNDIRIRIGAAIVLALLPFLRVSAQEVIPFNEEDLSFKDRIAIRTNVVGWVLTTPNIAFDYDVVNTPYDKRTVGLSLKCNWNTSHSRRVWDDELSSFGGWDSHTPNWTYNLIGGRFDYRFYWRQQPYDNRDNFYGDWEREWINSAKGLDKLRARLNCYRASEKPKSHISIFAGPYFSIGGFSIKYPTEIYSQTGDYSVVGRKGVYVGAGATGGIALPLYGYENGAAIDLEFGGCLGLQYASFRKTDVDKRRNSFLPLVTDVRVSLVYRFRSISKQHTEIDYALIDRRYVDRLMELDWDAALIYNDSIRALKDELDLRNQEIAQYKQSVEGGEEFNDVYSLEYLTPYMYMMEAPRHYTRYNKDTLPKVHIDSIEQIVDPILLSVREELDSIPHVTSAQIDKEFINQYNNLSDADGKLVNRTALIREIYTRLNSYIEDNNSKLVASTFGADVHTEKLNKYNVKQQGRSLVEITYKDSVRTVEMTSNDKIEWLNNIKKQAWADAQKRMRGEYPGRVEMPEFYDFLAPDVVNTDSLLRDSLLRDSLRLDSIRLDSIRLDSMRLDSLMADSLRLDSMSLGVVFGDSIISDSLFSDSLLSDTLVSDSLLVDSLHRVARVDEVEVKAKKKKKDSSKVKSEAKSKKADKNKKSKKKEVEDVQPAEHKDSVAVTVDVAVTVVDSLVAPVAIPDSIASEVVPDTTQQVVLPVKEEKAKKAEKTKKTAKPSKEESAEKPDKASKNKKAEKVEAPADADSVEVVETETSEQGDASEKAEKAPKAEKKGKAPKPEKAKKEKKSKPEVSKDVEPVDSVGTDSLTIDSIPAVEVKFSDEAVGAAVVKSAVDADLTEQYALRSKDYLIKEDEE